MGKVLPLSDAEFRLLASLINHEIRFMVVGLSAAALQGAPVVTAVRIKVGNLELKALPLDRILASKQAANRPKDQLVLPVLRNSLSTIQAKKARRKKN